MGYYSRFTGEIPVVGTPNLGIHFVQLWNLIVQGDEGIPDGWPQPATIGNNSMHPEWSPWYLSVDCIGTPDLVEAESTGKYYNCDAQLAYLMLVINQEYEKVRFDESAMLQRDGEDQEDIEFFRVRRENDLYMVDNATAVITPGTWSTLHG